MAAIEVPLTEYSVVSAKGQVVIPRGIRERLGIEAGTKLAWIVRNGRLTVLPVPRDPITALVGVLEGEGSTDEELLEERRRDLAAEEARSQSEDAVWTATS